MDFQVTRAVLAQISAEAAAAHPHECCGVLLGRAAKVEEARTAANTHPSPANRFELDPQALIDAHRDARREGREVLGYYHSHPGGTSYPSETDRAMGAGDGKVWAIAGIDGITFWRDDGKEWEALSYAVLEG